MENIGHTARQIGARSCILDAAIAVGDNEHGGRRGIQEQGVCTCVGFCLFLFFGYCLTEALGCGQYSNLNSWRGCFCDDTSLLTPMGYGKALPTAPPLPIL